ncbi:MAG: hypothetical protein DRN15_04960 [Thermoprotei archaeon]|nr:MAG: hypothetical protein DRN15_04960 [Thermoprotei archaeon]RLF25621.1 MAG: hypothetical protein DRM97_01245 [Thermoprotei archaeon]
MINNGGKELKAAFMFYKVGLYRDSMTYSYLAFIKSTLCLARRLGIEYKGRNLEVVVKSIIKELEPKRPKIVKKIRNISDDVNKLRLKLSEADREKAADMLLLVAEYINTVNMLLGIKRAIVPSPRVILLTTKSYVLSSMISLAQWLRKDIPAIFILSFMILLISASIALSLGKASMADKLAEWAYYALVIGVLGRLIELMGIRRKKS